MSQIHLHPRLRINGKITPRETRRVVNRVYEEVAEVHQTMQKVKGIVKDKYNGEESIGLVWFKHNNVRKRIVLRTLMVISPQGVIARLDRSDKHGNTYR